MKCTYESYGTDIGNGFLKINDGRTPAWSTPSWYAEVPPGSQFNDLDLYSMHVRYLDGDRPDLKGKEWLIGPAAKSQTRLFQRAVDAGKIDIRLCLAMEKFWSLRLRCLQDKAADNYFDWTLDGLNCPILACKWDSQY
jgi:hypothetical protein